VFLANIDIAHTVEDVYNDVSKRLKVPVWGLYQSSHPHARKKSFVVIIPQNKSAVMYDIKNWEDGVIVREYRERTSPL
jgi:hypothetical protein